MLNQVILVGRIQENPELVTLEDGRKTASITLDIQRPYKNAESGEYDKDSIVCTLWAGIAENTVEYCKAGSTVGVKARLKAAANGTVTVIAEKITFINTKSE